MSPTFKALSHPQYRRYLLAQLSTGIGFWMLRLVQDWLVLDLTGGSGIAVGIATALQFIPFLIVTPWAGVLADRFSRRTLMIVAHIGLTLSAIALLVVVLTGVASLPVLFVLAGLTGVMAALDQPARQAMVGELVGEDHLMNAVALNSVAFNLARISGPALAGIMIASTGVPIVIGLIAVMFATALSALTSLRIARPTPGTGQQRATFVDGLRFLRRRPDLIFVLGTVFGAAMFALNFQLTTALMATQEFNGNAASLGILSTFLALGSLVGSLLAARRIVVRLRLVLVSGVAFSIATLVAGLMPTWSLFALALPLCGLTAMTFTTAAQSYLQIGTPDRLRGRIMGLYAMFFFAGTPVGAPMIGWLSDVFGPRIGLVGGGIGALVAVASMTGWLLRARRIPRGFPDTGTPSPFVPGDTDRMSTRP
jgi:MFS family permease